MQARDAPKVLSLTLYPRAPDFVHLGSTKGLQQAGRPGLPLEVAPLCSFSEMKLKEYGNRLDRVIFLLPDTVLQA